MSAGWKRTVHGDPSVERAPITYERDGWEIRKVFYADGPTMFVYEVHHLPRRLFLVECRTLTAAKRWVDANLPTLPAEESAR